MDTARRPLPTAATDHLPNWILADSMAANCGFPVEVSETKQLLRNEKYLDDLLQCHLENLQVDYQSHFVNALKLRISSALLNVDAPSQVVQILTQPPVCIPGSWISNDFHVSASHKLGWTVLPDEDKRIVSGLDPLRLRTSIWRLPAWLFGASLQGETFKGANHELCKLALGLGWRLPASLMLIQSAKWNLDSWAEIAPSHQWYESSPPNPSTLRESLANKRNGVVVSSKHVVGDARAADCLVATTLYKFAPYLHNQMATLNERQLDSWRKKFEDPAHGLWLETETPHAPEEVEAGWRELTLIYFRYLQQMLFATRLKVEPRIRWKFNGVVIVDTHA